MLRLLRSAGRLLGERGCALRVRRSGAAAARYLSLPAHEVIGMPALSPTMEVGTIINWSKAEGDLVNSGDTIAEIETDKATISFDAVDDAYLAKILVQAGSEVQVGEPIMVTVEEPEDVAAFSNFSVSTTSSVEPATEPVTESLPEPVASNSSPVEKTSPPPPPAPAPPVSEQSMPSPITPPLTPSASVSSSDVIWGSLILKTSPLVKLLAKEQKEYIEKFGNSSHNPLDC